MERQYTHGLSDLDGDGFIEVCEEVPANCSLCPTNPACPPIIP